MNKNMRKMYSEQEIAELVQKAITGGNITIPTGTKLYAHEIPTDNDEGRLMVIGTFSELINAESILYMENPSIIKMVLHTYIDGDTGYRTYLINYIDLNNNLYDTNDSTGDSINNYSLGEDTVTPL